MNETISKRKIIRASSTPVPSINSNQSRSPIVSPAKPNTRNNSCEDSSIVKDTSTKSKTRLHTIIIKRRTRIETDILQLGKNWLTPFQKDIFDECIAKGSGGLFVPMGSGKTLLAVTLSLHYNRINNGKSLIIVCKSILTSWITEISKFFGSKLKYEILHKEYIDNMSTWTIKQDTELIITTPEIIAKAFKTYNVYNSYSYLVQPQTFAPAIRFYHSPTNPYLRNTMGVGLLFSIKWASFMVDEAHIYLGLESDRCLGMCAISAHNKWLLSGTIFAEPKTSKLLAYYLMLDDPNCPRSQPDFKLYIKNPEFGGLNATLVKRETNEDYTPPTINKHIISHHLTSIESKIYTSVKELLSQLKKQLEESKQRGDVVMTKKFSSYILAMVSYLRLCLLCPLIPITSVVLNISDFRQKNELSNVFMNHIQKLNLHEWMDDVNSLYSSRIKSAIECLDNHKDKKIIIFSSFRTIIDVLKIYIPSDRPYFTITGSQKIEKRSSVIEEFKNSNNGILLLTYDIGSNGLNLQFCDTVIIMDLYWNSSKTEQAIARVCRFGQISNDINIYYLTANTGMENSILEMQKSKIELVNQLSVGASKSKIKKLKINDIIKLIDSRDNIKILDSIINR